MRSTIFFISTAAMLILVYMGYNSFMQAGYAEDAATELRRDLPEGGEPRRDETFLVSTQEMQARLPGSKVFEFTKYDPRTNRAVAGLRGETWRKLPDAADRIEVVKPELELLLPNGMNATITAEMSQLKIENLQKQKMEPQFGWLEGHVRIHVRRDSDAVADRGYARPEDGIIVETDRLDFNLELGELKTDRRVRAWGDLFDIHGIGLNLVFNRLENKLELLSIDRGETMSLWLVGGLNSDVRNAVMGETAASKPVASAPADVTPQGAPPRPRAATTYLARLDGNIFVDRILDEQRVGGMEAERLELLFDLGGRVSRAIAGEASSAADSQPAKPPAEPPILRERIDVAWTGRLVLGPAADAPTTKLARRHITAFGDPLVLDTGERTLLAGKLEYHDETQRLWLSPRSQDRIEISLGPQLSASSESIYIDQKQKLVKLVGETVLRARESAGSDPVSLRCDHWAELHLPSCEPVGGAPKEDALALLANREGAGSGAIESAVLVGNAAITLEGQSLRGERIEAWFLPRLDNEPLQALLDRVVATGNVRLLSGRDGAGPAWWQVLTAKFENPFASADPIQRAPQALQCGWLELDFARDAAHATYAASARALGAVRLIDREHDLAARGRELSARLGPGNDLQYCVVTGSGGQPAQIQSSAYDVRGNRINADPIAETLEVPGFSRLQFITDSTLRGEERAQAQPVVVTASERLFVNNKANSVDLVGRVDARSGEERLQARSLTLTLGDVAAPGAAAASTFATTMARSRKIAWEHLRRSLATASGQSALAREVEAPPKRRLSPTLAGTERGGVRKEALRMLAREALLTSESYAEAGESLPSVHQSLQAPEMEFDVKQRVVRSAGETILGMIDRRLAADERSASEATGMPAALMSRGPSLTHIRCKQSLVYQLGGDSAIRRDAVLFEGEVALRHFSGRELLTLPKASTVFPQFAARPESLDKFKSRYTELNCDRLGGLFEAADDKRPVRTGNRSQPALRLSSLNADGHVFLRDEQRPVIREVIAAQVEFDRAGTEIGVYGQKGGEAARIRSMNVQTQRYDEPYVGDALTIDLANNTVRTGPMRGSSNRN